MTGPAVTEPAPATSGATAERERPTVAAVVVTFNRREQVLNTLTAIATQSRPPDHVFVVDNASTDGTAAALAERTWPVPVSLLSPGWNSGGAGGFFLGMREAYAAGYDYLWVCDDDAVPATSALERLLTGQRRATEALAAPPVFACSLVTWVDGQVAEMNLPVARRDWPRLAPTDPRLVLVDACSFVSVLVPREQITRHGLPDPSFILWFDDVEFTTRLTAEGPGVAVLDSVVVHATAANAAADVALVTEENLWKYRLGTRNEVATAVRRGQWLRAARVLQRTWQGSAPAPTSVRVRLLGSGLQGLRATPHPLASPAAVRDYAARSPRRTG